LARSRIRKVVVTMMNFAAGSVAGPSGVVAITNRLVLAVRD
jgi:hypothetical protein